MSIINVVTFDPSAIDSTAITIFIIGFSVVFGALLSIYVLFYFLPRLLNIKIKKKTKPVVTEKADKAIVAKTNVDSEVYAAIAMAISLLNEDIHDEESLVLTIDLKDRLSAGWSSKVQNLNVYNY